MSETGSELAQQLSGSTSRRTSAFDIVQSMRGELAKALPSTLSVDTFLRLSLTELRQKPELTRCSAQSLLGALMTAARLGLEPGGPLGQFYLTPRHSRKDDGWVVVPIIGYQGMRDLAYRSGFVASLTSIVVREGDHFAQGANERRGKWFDWEPLDADSSRDITGVIALAEMTTGGRVFRHLDMAQVLARRDRGAAGDSGPWRTDREAMVAKTGIRALAPDLPKSATFAHALSVDEQVQTYRPGDAEGSGDSEALAVEAS